ncbi:MAG: cytochrome c biogenesis protein CcsA [Coriobacteriia bacterium]|nr:cytochrome c biogenesis protein CcsA [Coriobacteriia bacterium]
MTTEIIIMWATVTLYALSAVALIVGYVFEKPRVVAAPLWLVAAGLLTHATAIGIRWARVGHGPYVGFYEVVSGFAFVSSAIYLYLGWRKPVLRIVGTVLMPLSFLAIGGAMMAPTADMDLTGTLASYWLGVHVAFAKLAYGSFITAFAFAVLYLVFMKRHELPPDAPKLVTLDDLSFKFLAAGFIFLGIMIAVGAIWANEAWGRYWGWDPIETWSLISWFCYAFTIHLRVTMGWRDRKWALAAIVPLPVVLFALMGVAVIYQTVHGAYLIGG